MPRKGNERIEQIFGAQVVLQKLAAVRAVVLVEPHAEIAVCLLPREGIESIHAVDDHEAVPLAAVLVGNEKDVFGGVFDDVIRHADKRREDALLLRIVVIDEQRTHGAALRPEFAEALRDDVARPFHIDADVAVLPLMGKDVLDDGAGAGNKFFFAREEGEADVRFDPVPVRFARPPGAPIAVLLVRHFIRAEHVLCAVAEELIEIPRDALLVAPQKFFQPALGKELPLHAGIAHNVTSEASVFPSAVSVPSG